LADSGKLAAQSKVKPGNFVAVHKSVVADSCYAVVDVHAAGNAGATVERIGADSRYA